TVRAIAEVDRQRIEGEAEEARVAEQQHAAAGEIDAVLVRTGLCIVAQARAVARSMVLLMEAIEASSIDRKQRRHAVGVIEPVEINQQAHDAVAEAMGLRLEARMHHLAEIESRWIARGHLGYSAACASAAGSLRQGA